MKKITLSLLVLLTFVSARAYNFESGGIYYDITSEEEKTVTVTNNGEYGAYSGDVVIPSSVVYDGVTYMVTGIGESAFSNCNNLTSVIMPEGILTISYEAFIGCSKLVSINIPSSVTSIGYRAFSYCSGLESIEVDSRNEKFYSNGNNVIISKSDGGGIVLLGCKNTIIPDGVSIIDNYSFSNITTIKIPSSVVHIGSEAFDGCEDIVYNEYDNALYLGNDENPYLFLIKAKNYEITTCDINNKTYCVQGNAFYNCANLTSIEIPEGVKAIDMYAFSDCISLTSVKIPSSVTYIRETLFYRCNSLTTIEIDPENEVYDSRNNCNAIIETGTNKLLAGCKSTIIPQDVYTIGSCAFYGCSSLRTIEIPESVTTIDSNAFANCSSLMSLGIPSSITAIDINSLIGCVSLVSINVDIENTRYDSRNNCNAIIETETNTLIIGCVNTTIPESVTTIGDNAFYMSDLTMIHIPENIMSIGKGAFAYCSNLSSIEIPESLTSIGENAFSGCHFRKFFYNANDESVVTTFFDGTWSMQDFIDDRTVVFVPAVLVDDYRATYNGVRFIGYNNSEEEVAEEEPEWSVDLDENSIEFIAETVNSGETLFGKEVAVSLKGDLDLSESETGWITLGTQEHPFKGELNGNGHTLILGNEELESNINDALFGVVSEEATIKSLNVENVYVDYQTTSDIRSEDGKETYYGLLAKTNSGTIKNCVVTGAIADKSDRTAVACLVAENRGTIDHCVVYFTGIEGETDKQDVNKRKIIVMQNVGVGRHAGHVIKTASNGKRRASTKAATLGSMPKFTEADINSDYRIYSDEEMATGEPAYWLNMSGQGYTGEYTGEWSMSSDDRYPVVVDSVHNKVVKIEYEVENVDSKVVGLDGSAFAKVESTAELTYDLAPEQITGDVEAIIEDRKATFTVPEPNDSGIVSVTIKYAKGIGIENIKINKVNVETNGNEMSISGAEGTHVSVVDLMGRQVYSGRTTSESVVLNLPSAGIYMVKAGDVVEKVVVR